MNSQGVPVVMSRNCEIVLVDDKGRERARFRVPYGARLLVGRGRARSRARQKLAEWDPYTLPIITERAGTGRVSRPDRRRDAGRAHGRGDRPHLEGGGRLQAGAPRASICGRACSSRTSKGEVRASCRTAPMRATSSRRTRSSRSRTARRWRPATCWRASRARAARRATSPAVCRAWPSCSRRGVRRTTRSSPRPMGAWSSARTTRRSAASS